MAVLVGLAGLSGLAIALAPLLQLRRSLRRRQSADVSVGCLATIADDTSAWEDR